MSCEGTLETTEDLTDRIIRAYEDVRQQMGDDPTSHPDQRDRVTQISGTGSRRSSR